jgi:two-component system OmpR family sensor kinase
LLRARQWLADRILGARQWPVSRAHAARRWLADRTLRARLIAGLLTLLALTCAAVGLVTYTHLRSVLISQLDTELTSANLRYAACYRAPKPAAMCAQQQTTAAFTAVITGPHSVSYPYMAGVDGRCDLTAADRRAIARVRVGSFVTVDLSSYRDYRMTASQTDNGVLLIGLPLSPVTHMLRLVALTEVAVFLAALIIAGVIGTMWVGIALRPLRRVAATATRVTRLPLTSGKVKLPERVPTTSTATEVGQVGAAFNRMLGHVEAAFARREASESRLRTFAADASHELRTPLAAIRGYAELAHRHGRDLPDEVAHALSRVESEAGRMSELVDDLLLLTRLDAGRPLASGPVDVTRLIIDATSDARVAASDHQWQLRLPAEPVTVRGDEQGLRQVLANLLTNAGRHTPAGTQVTIALDLPGSETAPAAGHADCDPASPGPASPGPASSAPGPPGRADPGPGPAGHEEPAAATVVVTVTDDGPGIPADLQPDVFERFARGEVSRSRAAGGSGLGLAIVRAVTAAHGGTAAVTSRPGETRFTITLPPAPAEQADPGKPEARQA